MDLTMPVARTRIFIIIAALVVLTGGLLLWKGEGHAPLQGKESEKREPAASLKNWRTFKDPQGNFKVLLPAIPQHATDKIIDPDSGDMRHYSTYVASDDHGTAFMVSTITMPHQIKDGQLEEKLKSIVNEMLNRNKENKLQKMRLDKQANALDFWLSNDQLVIAGRIIAYGNTVYVLSSVDNKDSYSQEELNFFVNSFERLPENANAAKDKQPSKKLK